MATKEDLSKKTLADLRSIAKSLKINPAGKRPADLVREILKAEAAKSGKGTAAHPAPKPVQKGVAPKHLKVVPKKAVEEEEEEDEDEEVEADDDDEEEVEEATDVEADDDEDEEDDEDEAEAPSPKVKGKKPAPIVEEDDEDEAEAEEETEAAPTDALSKILMVVTSLAAKLDTVVGVVAKTASEVGVPLPKGFAPAAAEEETEEEDEPAPKAKGKGKKAKPEPEEDEDEAEEEDTEEDKEVDAELEALGITDDEETEEEETLSISEEELKAANMDQLREWADAMEIDHSEVKSPRALREMVGTWLKENAEAEGDEEEEATEDLPEHIFTGNLVDIFMANDKTWKTGVITAIEQKKSKVLVRFKDKSGAWGGYADTRPSKGTQGVKVVAKKK